MGETWAEVIACSKCEAPALHRCVDARGEKREPHADRVRDARAAGHAPRRGRQRTIEGGEQGRMTMRLGTEERRALDAYRAKHGQPDLGDVPAARGIFGEWLASEES